MDYIEKKRTQDQRQKIKLKNTKNSKIASVYLNYFSENTTF